MLKVYNTLSRKKEEFSPQGPPDVKMYVCGITPYDECHAGHARCYVVFDVIRRWLEYRGYKVRYVQNFTDIDDKIIAKTKEKSTVHSPQSTVAQRAKEIAERYIKDYFTQMDALNVKRADEYPKVTEHIKEIIEIVGALINKSYAYVVDGDVYFEVAKFKEYGKLSHRAADEMTSGARVEVDERKKSPLDFAVWKKAKEDEPSWDSPWGKGRPGWHIECSVMSGKYLGDSLDIHGGGQDLIFPHHENEIAQSKAVTEKELARYWIHNGFVTINKEKMSKSLGNFFTVREVLEKYEPMVVRLFLLSAHYRQPMDFSDKELDAARETLERMRIFRNNLNFAIASINEHDKSGSCNVGQGFSPAVNEIKQKFEEAMDDDFNTPKALGYVHELITSANVLMSKIEKDNEAAIKSLKEAEDLFGRFTEVLGLKIETKSSSDEYISLIKKREEARKNKDWATADRIRDELKNKGITIEDTPLGPRLIVK